MAFSSSITGQLADDYTGGQLVSLLEGGYNGDFYDITPDDQRFLMGRQLSTNEDGSHRLVLVQHWYEEVRKRLGS